MKFIYVLILGLVLFNGFLLAFSSFFPQSAYGPENPNVANVANETVTSSYSGGIVNLGSFGVDALLTGGVTMGAIISFALLGAIIGRGQNLPLWLGVGVIIGLISSLWLITTKVFTPMFGYPVVREIYTVITIVIGILVILGLADIVTLRSDSTL